MIPLSFKFLRVVAPFAAAAAFSMGSLPAMAQTPPAGCASIRLEIGNPSPGSRVEVGSLVVSGIAMDRRAASGLGIASVDFFLDSRESGGMNLGSVVPGATPGPAGFGSFRTTLTIPKLTGGHDFFAYAHSTVSNSDVVVSMPVAVNTDPSKIGLTPDAVSTTTCRVGGTVVSSSSAAAAPTTPSPAPIITSTPSTPAAATESTIVLNVANPSAGNLIKVGKLSVQGDAMDRAAKSGTGIDRVDVFLDNPDNGGMMIGSATMGPGTAWQAFVTLPSNHTGLHNLNFVAHSSVTGATSTVVVPVVIAQ